MKKLIKPASLVFFLLMTLVFFMVGIYAAGILGAGKGQMLAGGAIVFMWGVSFAIIAFTSSLFMAYALESATIVKMNWFLVLSLLLLSAITYFRYQQREQAKMEENPQKAVSKPR